MLTKQRLSEIEEQLMHLQHELQSAVSCDVQETKVQLHQAQDQAIQQLHTARAWVSVMQGYMVR